MELHKCDVCSYRSYSYSVLENVHKKIHSNEKSFICEVCGKAFKNKKQLINHTKRHSSKPLPEVVRKPLKFECELCGRSFTDARALRVHNKQVHIKLRPYTCSQVR